MRIRLTSVMVGDPGTALTAFAVDDIERKTVGLKELGVPSTLEAAPTGPTTAAVIDGTCRNPIESYQA